MPTHCAVEPVFSPVVGGEMLAKFLAAFSVAGVAFVRWPGSQASRLAGWRCPVQVVTTFDVPVAPVGPQGKSGDAALVMAANSLTFSGHACLEWAIHPC